ncbi:helix-turn-helix domain-containing protein [Endozoicomonas acroporae]|uniref:helix-turn-helix domain-containing protein n=1 Tax=Endozoicomonas acroporae TaxID=1701104 RepID=UPI003D7BE41A
MANNYLNAAYALELPFGQKAVLTALANRADKKTGECFPSIRCLTADTGLGRSTVINHLNSLVKAGHIAKSFQFRKDNSQRSNLYKLLIGVTKTVKKAVKKGFDKAVEMGKEFTCAVKSPAMGSVKLEYDNAQWLEIRADICNRAMELYPNANPELVMDAVEHHLEYWMNAANNNRRLKLTRGQLRAQFFQKEREFLGFLNQARVIDPVELLEAV